MAQVVVRTNSFRIDVHKKPLKAYFQHDAFDLLGTPGRKVDSDQRRRLLNQLETNHAQAFQFQGCIFDGQAILYAPVQLQTMNYTETLGGNPARARQVVISITFVARVDINVVRDLLDGRSVDRNQVLNAITMMNILLRHAPAQNHSHNARSFFPGNERLRVPDSALELWRGYYQSVRILNAKLVVNVDITTAVMYRAGPLIDAFMDHFRLRNPRQLRCTANSREFKAFNRRKRIRCLVPEGAAGRVFQLQDGQERTVQAHFRIAHNVRLEFPEIPAVELPGGAVIPMECVSIPPGQFFRKTLDAGTRTKMLEFSKKRPNERLQTIQDALPHLHWNDGPAITNSGLVIDQEAVAIAGNMLAIPQLFFGNNEQGQPISETPNGGRWDVMRKRFFKPADVRSYAVLVYSDRPNRERVFKCLEDLTAACRSLGMGFPFPPRGPPIEFLNGQATEEQMLGVIKAHMKTASDRALQVFREPATLFIVILPDTADLIRRSVKYIGDVLIGFATQCMKYSKFVLKGGDQYNRNVALKINAKLEGIASTARGPGLVWLKNSEGLSMIMGADVSHAPPSSPLPSVAAVVTSLDDIATRYVADSRVQPARVEEIVDLTSMVLHLISMFVKYNRGRGPSRIIFYRDGLSEGEFDRVAREEFRAIKAAAQAYWEKNKIQMPLPLLLYAVAIKRHHVRFFPQKPDRGDNTGNLPAGFVVNARADPGDGEGRDHFLLSHSGLLGTSRPTHYNILRDEIRMPVDRFKSLSFELAHNYARSTRSVSIAAPVYYADLVAQRAKFHLPPNLDFSDTSTDGGDRNEVYQNISGQWKPANPATQRSMYWM